ncbi:methyltransferase domain-containing protein [Methanobacterium formicicum]|uniref:Trans-aconitate 2-methyltransferase n=1 Tax=Methanobacterium formicicum (strain DSM 3637 / PP1) TaxID=1204725 RepID=K2RS36_METFP|nr:methyltransferase domain-containing protein [Methanobacterium formicicum]EKF85585.1 Trans-aconitate 2-methyltransferase [Methanobacterium formicicum DSM 3637]
MQTTKDWNPELYLKFNEERTQPAKDLAARINIENPGKIMDVGCGPGNSTNILSSRWPESELVGIDSSVSMIESAMKNYPDIEWRIEDATKMETEEKYDIIFSNATIQWIPDQKKLISDLVGMLETGGALAVQVPMYHNMPASHVIDGVSLTGRWKELTSGASDAFTFHSSDYYYHILSSQVKSINMWQTSYFHIMPSHENIVEMLKSTGMRKFLDMLETREEKLEFEKDVLKEIKKAYSSQKDGNVLFPFKRLFFIGYK